MNSTTDLYRALGVPPDASADRITKAYRRLAKRYHPDRNVGDDEAKRRYALVSLAYEVLTDPDRRARYDATGETDVARVNQALAELAAVLAPCFAQVIDALAAQDRPAEYEDVVAQMTFVLAEHTRRMEKIRAHVEKVKAGTEAALGRLSSPEGEENLFAAIGRQQVAECTAKLAALAHEAARMGRAAEYIKRCRYSRDPVSGSSAHTLLRQMMWSVSG